jgi:hypothetical protein
MHWWSGLRGQKCFIHHLHIVCGMCGIFPILEYCWLTAAIVAIYRKYKIPIQVSSGSSIHGWFFSTAFQ